MQPHVTTVQDHFCSTCSLDYFGENPRCPVVLSTCLSLTLRDTDSSTLNAEDPGSVPTRQLRSPLLQREKATGNPTRPAGLHLEAPGKVSADSAVCLVL